MGCLPRIRLTGRLMKFPTWMQYDKEARECVGVAPLAGQRTMKSFLRKSKPAVRPSPRRTREGCDTHVQSRRFISQLFSQNCWPLSHERSGRNRQSRLLSTRRCQSSSLREVLAAGAVNENSSRFRPSNSAALKGNLSGSSAFCGSWDPSIRQCAFAAA